MKNQDCVYYLTQAGIALDDAMALRRISMTLHRWHELECGDSNDRVSRCLVRGRMHRISKPAASTPGTEFEYDDKGMPFIETHYHDAVRPRYYSTPDRERGALKRLEKIMARYPGFASYVQGDPRGCALYILPASLNPLATTFGSLDANYTRGIAVYK